MANSCAEFSLNGSMMTTEQIDSPVRRGNPVTLDGSIAHGVTASLKTKNLRISLKQWKMFHAVIDADGFFGAADSLNVTQSTISQALAKLQDLLGVPILVLKGRKAHITEEGQILLERSRNLIRNAIELEELAENLRGGMGAEIRLTADPSFPLDLLTRALRELSITLPKIRLSVKEATDEQTRLALHNSAVDLAISTHMAPGFLGRKLLGVEYVAVAHPSNLLFALKREITSDELRMRCQVAISGVDDYVASQASDQMSRCSQVWNVSSLDRAIQVLRQVVGYAWLPRHQIQQALDDHQIRILPLVGGSSYSTSLYLLYGRSVAPESVAARFADHLHASSAGYFDPIPPIAAGNSTAERVHSRCAGSVPSAT